MTRGERTPEPLPSLAGRTFIVTGANSGIGFEAARGFAGAGARTVLACRDLARAEAAAVRIRTEHPAAAVETARLDLADLASVREFAAEAVGRYPRIDVLCNNAGVMAPPRRLTTADGFELQFGVNHLGHFALTGLLFDHIAAAAPARIVTVSSIAHRGPALDFTDLQHERGYTRPHHPWLGYMRSKLANLLFAYELDRRITARGLGVASVACHPGVAASNLINGGPQAANARPGPLLRLGYLAAQSAERGALPTIRAAVGEDVRGGQFIGPSGPGQTRGLPRLVHSSRRSHDVEAARRLWAVSQELTGVRFLD